MRELYTAVVASEHPEKVRELYAAVVASEHPEKVRELYAAVVASEHPEKVRELYAAVVASEHPEKVRELYAAVVASEHPEKVRELFAYQAMMVNEARRCGGRGWLLFDAAFRQQVQSFGTIDFAKINQSLFSTTFLAYGASGGGPASAQTV